MVGEGGRGKIGAEAVALAAVEVDLERLGVVDGAEGGFAFFGFEAVGVVGDAAEELHAPFLGRMPPGVGLQVDEARVVLALRVE